MLSLKEQIKKAEGYPEEKQTLSLGETELKDKQSLSACGVTEESELHLTLSDLIVTVTAEGGGGASATPASGPRGTEITLAAEAEEGYAFQEWTVLSGGVTVAEDRFLLGAEDVEIRAVFAPEVTPSPSPTPTPRPYVPITPRLYRGGSYTFSLPRAGATPTPSPTPTVSPAPTASPTPSPTPKPTENPYTLTAEAAERGMIFTLTGEGASLNHLTGVRVDAQRLNATAYEVDFNAMTVTLKREYLATLEGGHTLTLALGAAAAEAEFTPELPELPADVGETPKERNLTPWWALLALPAAVGCGYYLKRKKKTG